MNKLPKGFVPIPGYPHHLINIHGRLIRKSDGGLVKGSRNPAGYVHFRIWSAVHQDWRTIGRHRLLCIVFKPVDGPMDELFVNHINGIPGDDFLDNLEWVTPKENVEHAGALGISPKCLPVQVRDVDTLAVTEYPSIIECARQYGVTKDFINWRIRSSGKRTFPERRQYRLASETGDWGDVINIERDIESYSNHSPVLLRNLQDDTVTLFETKASLATYLNVSNAAITEWAKTDGQRVLPGLYQIKSADSTVEWGDFEDMYIEHERWTKKRVVVVNRVGYPYSTIYLSAAECAKATGLKPTALSHRLKTKGKVIFRDNCSYRYYTDVV